MIKKSVFENDLIIGMQRELQSYNKKQGMSNLDTAVDCLHSAVEILEESGLNTQADKIIGILLKIANEGKTDSHTNGLTSDKMLKNLGEHGTVFNMVDDSASDDMLNLDVGDNGLEVTDEDSSFEKTFEDAD